MIRSSVAHIISTFSRSAIWTHLDVRLVQLNAIEAMHMYGALIQITIYTELFLMLCLYLFCKRIKGARTHAPTHSQTERSVTLIELPCG